MTASHEAARNRLFATPLPPECRHDVWTAAVFRVVSPVEARAGLVPASVFKTDEALREQRLGGFDSHALPPCYATFLNPRGGLNQARTRLGPGRLALSAWGAKLQAFTRSLQSSPSSIPAWTASDLQADPSRMPSASSISRSQTARTARRSSRGAAGHCGPARWQVASTPYSRARVL